MLLSIIYNKYKLFILEKKMAALRINYQKLTHNKPCFLIAKRLSSFSVVLGAIGLTWIAYGALQKAQKIFINLLLLKLQNLSINLIRRSF